MKKILSMMMALIIGFSLTACSNNDESEKTSTASTSYEDPYDIDIYKSDDLDIDGNIIGQTENNNDESSNQEEARLPDIIVHFIDVGQADCTLIQTPKGKNILIDGGNKADGNDLIKYLKYLKVEKLDIIIATHPHEDHIGGLPAIIEQFDVGEIYMPYIEEKYIPTTKIYEDFLIAISSKEITVSEPQTEKNIFSEDSLSLDCLYGGELGKDDYNTYSIVTMLKYGNNKFIFTGDADIDVENEILSHYGGPWYEFEEEKSVLDCDVLKVGHHGSSTASGIDWLKTLTPEYSIIPCEAGNTYGHPHDIVIKNLNSIDSLIYNMTECGTVVIRSNGKELEVTDKCTGDYPLGSQEYDDTIKLPYTP